MLLLLIICYTLIITEGNCFELFSEKWYDRNKETSEIYVFISEFYKNISESIKIPLISSSHKVSKKWDKSCQSIEEIFIKIYHYGNSLFA